MRFLSLSIIYVLFNILRC